VEPQAPRAKAQAPANEPRHRSFRVESSVLTARVQTLLVGDAKLSPEDNRFYDEELTEALKARKRRAPGHDQFIARVARGADHPTEMNRTLAYYSALQSGTTITDPDKLFSGDRGLHGLMGTPAFNTAVLASAALESMKKVAEGGVHSADKVVELLGLAQDLLSGTVAGIDLYTPPPLSIPLPAARSAAERHIVVGSPSKRDRVGGV